MKKRKLTKVFILLLTMIMVFALPIEAGAASKVTAVTKQSKAKAVKKGKTTVTIPKTSKQIGYVKFKAPSTKTYKFTVNNIRRSGKKSTNDIMHSFVNILTKDSYGYTSMSFKQNGKKTSTLWICSKRSWQINKPYVKKITADTGITSRTASIRLKKGQTVYLQVGNVHSFKMCYDLTIK